MAQVYFRDTRSFLPYVQRIWLYTSPVLWFADDMPAKFEGLKTLEWFNPLYSILGGWSSILIENEKPGLMMTGIALAWAIGTLVVGTLVFMTRERDFAVRI